MVAFNPNNTTLVCFHGNCPDGMGAAWAAFKKLGKRARYWQSFHGDDPPDCTGENVAIFDFCYPHKQMVKIHKECKHVAVRDHHISAEKDMESFKGGDIVFDQTKSGAVLAWEYFWGNKPIPTMLRMIQDVDLWTRTIEGSDCFVAGLTSENMTFSRMDWAASNPEKVIEIGKPIIEARNKHCEKVAKFSSICKINGIDFHVANEPDKSKVSYAGQKIIDLKNTPAALWSYSHEDNQFSVSLRSNESVGVDVSEIAKKFGGGGHKFAAAFKSGLPLDEIFKK